MSVKREELFGAIVEYNLAKLIKKDEQYAGDTPVGAIRKATIFVDPKSMILQRIQEKWNRILENPRDEDILDEELFDIWGYIVLREACKRLDKLAKIPKDVPLRFEGEPESAEEDAEPTEDDIVMQEAIKVANKRAEGKIQ